MATADDDALVLRKAAAGDDAAAAIFHARHAPFIWSVVRRFALDDDEALDAAQETFLRVFRRGAFDGRSAITTWLFRVASSAAIDLVRSPRAQRHAPLDDAPEPARQPHTTDHALRARIAHAIAELPDPLRDAFIWCEIMERSHAEVSAQLGIPESSSRRRVSEAKSRLRLALGALKQGHDDV